MTSVLVLTHSVQSGQMFSHQSAGKWIEERVDDMRAKHAREVDSLKVGGPGVRTPKVF